MFIVNCSARENQAVFINLPQLHVIILVFIVYLL